MKVRMIGAIRKVNEDNPPSGLWLESVKFPMQVTNYEATNPREPGELPLYNEKQLRQWADRTFGEGGYEIWDMDVPVPDSLPVLQLISSKKQEYRRAAAVTPEARSAREAVIAALDTLQTHARALL